MLKKILIGLVVVAGGLLAFAATRPDTFHIERSATMAAPAAVIFPMVSDFHAWPVWSPWEKMDPTMKKSYEGGSGVGAKYAWEGNKKVGQGQMTVTELRPSEQIGLKLEFKKPFEATNDVTFTFKSEGQGTQVTWSMDGKNNLMGKVMGIFMNMDSMVGKDFETGLATLKGAAEVEAKKQAEKAQAEAAKKAAEAADAARAAAAPVAAAPARSVKK